MRRLPIGVAYASTHRNNMHKKIELDNGVRVILNNMPHMESATVGVWIATGSRNEEERISGISHFLEHMVFKGTPARSTQKIKDEIEGRGGSLNGFTSEELTCYLAKVSARHVNIALDVLSDMALHAKVAKTDLERERNVIIEEIKMYRDLPNHQVIDILSELMWPDHALGRSVAGTIGSVSDITQKDLLDYKKMSYTPKNIVVVLCGKLKEADILKKINTIFSHAPKGGSIPITRFDHEQVRPQANIFFKDSEQTRISIGVHAFGRMHKDRYGLTLMHIILGANMSSRLFENIREKKGLAYEIGSDVKRYLETGGFVVHAGTSRSQAREVVSLILKELKKVKDAPVSLNELKKAKEYFKVQLLLALEDTMDHMLWLGERVVLSGKLPDKKAVIKKIDSVSCDDLQRIARSIFKTNGLSLAVVGPIKDKEAIQLKKELAL